jgi:hypothetical protein
MGCYVCCYMWQTCEVNVLPPVSFKMDPAASWIMSLHTNKFAGPLSKNTVSLPHMYCSRIRRKCYGGSLPISFLFFLNSLSHTRQFMM